MHYSTVSRAVRWFEARNGTSPLTNGKEGEG
nr:hypothetical protein [Thiohalomonas denitrificans]